MKLSEKLVYEALNKKAIATDQLSILSRKEEKGLKERYFIAGFYSSPQVPSEVRGELRVELDVWGTEADPGLTRIRGSKIRHERNDLHI